MFSCLCMDKRANLSSFMLYQSFNSPRRFNIRENHLGLLPIFFEARVATKVVEAAHQELDFVRYSLIGMVFHLKF